MSSVWVQVGPELREFPITEVAFEGEFHDCVSDEAVAAFAERWVLDGEAIGETRDHTPASAEVPGTPWIFATLDPATFRGVPRIRFHFWETVDAAVDLWRLDRAPIEIMTGRSSEREPGMVRLEA